MKSVTRLTQLGKTGIRTAVKNINKCEIAKCCVVLNINKETTSFPAAGIRTAVKNTNKCDIAKWCVVLNIDKETTSFPAAVTTKKNTRLRESFPLEPVNFFFSLHQVSSHKLLSERLKILLQRS